MVEVLLEAGASLEWQTTSGVTALMGAAMTGATEVITQLVLAGCSLDVQDGTGMTALHGAASVRAYSTNNTSVNLSHAWFPGDDRAWRHAQPTTAAAALPDWPWD